MPTDPEGRLLLVAALGAGMAHEMRNVLAAAESSLYLAAKLGDDPALRAKHVDAARNHVRTAQGLVDRALAPARNIALVAEPVAVGELCARAAATARLGDHTSLAIRAEPGLQVVGDELLIERAIINLIENAAGSSGERTVQVVVSARAEADGGVRVEVRDDGPGIPDVVKARMFEPLATAREGGTGLGLPLVRAIIEAHRGRVEVESDAGGTRVCLVFPAASAC